MAKKRNIKKKLLTGRLGWVQPEDMPDDFAREVLEGKRCGAQKADGEGYCRKTPYRKKGERKGDVGPWRCEFHGGKGGAPLGNQNARRHGIYSNSVTVEELNMLIDESTINTKSVEFEIKMTKIRLKRAYEAEFQQILKLGEGGDQEEKSILEIMETEEGENEDGETFFKIKKRRTDYPALISDLIRQLCKLVATKMSAEGENTENIEDIAKKVREAIGEDIQGPARGHVNLTLHSLYGPNGRDMAN